MQWLFAGIGKLFGLFVDDGSLAVSAVVWVGLCSVCFRYLSLPASWGGPILFIGLAAVVVENALRGTRKKRC
jgi:hypothetical protein